jgi:phage baseplate assembly protein W
MSTINQSDFIGSGWAFPVAVNPRGGIDLARGADDVNQAIRVVLSTPIGERRMRPLFGCGIHDYVFAPNEPGTHGLIRHEVLEALRLWEPRIEVSDVTLEVDEENPSVLNVGIDYVLRATNERRNLVFPFYLIPQEPAQAY